MTAIFFEGRLTARGVRLNPAHVPAVFKVRRTHEVEVTLRLPDEEEQEIGHKLENALCEGQMNFEPNDKIVGALRALAEHRVPTGGKPRSEWSNDWTFIDEAGNLRDNHIAPWEVLPQSLQSYLTQSWSEVDDAIRASVGALRWRLADKGLHQPFSGRGSFFSFDGANWMRAPMQVFVSLSEVGDLRITDGVARDVQVLLDEGENEPLAHALWREGWEQRHANRRSALLLGISAVEVGVKQFISSRVPDADWMLEEAPTPPITRMLAEYLPKLPAQDQWPIRIPPPELLKTIKKGVDLRNKVAHTGRSTYSYETLEEVLLAVRDVLWLLDSNTGRSWADSHMRNGK
jgi:hypothetical protein